MNPVSTNHMMANGHALKPNGYLKGSAGKGELETAEAPAIRERKAPQETVAQKEQLPEDKQVRGVIRSLQEGHFKGVAAVRLSINFYEELSVQQGNSQFESAKKALDSLITEVSEIESNLPEDVATELGGAVSELQSNLTNLVAQVENMDSLAEGAKSSFEAFNNIAGPLSEQRSGEVAGEQGGTTDGALGVSSNDGSISDQSALIGRVSDFEVVFTNFIQFIEGLESAIDPDVIPEPNGNGVAFDKFMKIYQGMQSGSTDSTMEMIDPGEPILNETV